MRYWLPIIHGRPQINGQAVDLPRVGCWSPASFANWRVGSAVWALRQSAVAACVAVGRRPRYMLDGTLLVDRISVVGYYKANIDRLMRAGAVVNHHGISEVRCLVGAQGIIKSLARQAQLAAAEAATHLDVLAHHAERGQVEQAAVQYTAVVSKAAEAAELAAAARVLKTAGARLRWRDASHHARVVYELGAELGAEAYCDNAEAEDLDEIAERLDGKASKPAGLAPKPGDADESEFEEEGIPELDPFRE